MNKKKQKYYRFIRNISGLTVKDVCKENNIAIGNIINGRASEEKMKIVRDNLDYKIRKIYLEECMEELRENGKQADIL